MFLTAFCGRRGGHTVYIIGLMVTGFLLIGAGEYLIQLEELLEAIGKLKEHHKGLGCALRTQTFSLHEQGCKLDVVWRSRFCFMTHMRSVVQHGEKFSAGWWRLYLIWIFT